MDGPAPPSSLIAFDDLLTHPGLDVHLLADLGPLAFHRLRVANEALRRLAPPICAWMAHWAVPSGQLECRSTALELLRCSKAESSISEREALLDELFILTESGQPAASQTHGPTHNLLDVAVTRLLRPMIPLLLWRGYSLEMLDAYSLESMVQQDRGDAVAAYLEAGASPDLRANAGRSMLMVAAAWSAIEVTYVLIKGRADVHQQSGFGQWTALMWAAHVGFADGCKLLLHARARIEDQNAQGATALEIARGKRGGASLDVLLAASGGIDSGFETVAGLAAA